MEIAAGMNVMPNAEPGAAGPSAARPGVATYEGANC